MHAPSQTGSFGWQTLASSNHSTYSLQMQNEVLQSQLNMVSLQLCEANAVNTSLKFAYLELLNTVKSLQSTASSTSVEPTSLVNANDLYPEPEQLDHKDSRYKNVKFWFVSEWKSLSAKQNGETHVDIEGTSSDDRDEDDSDKDPRTTAALCLKTKGNARASQGINVALRFICNIDGNIIDGHRATAIRSRACEIWHELYKHKLVPKWYNDMIKKRKAKKTNISLSTQHPDRHHHRYEESASSRNKGKRHAQSPVDDMHDELDHEHHPIAKRSQIGTANFNVQSQSLPPTNSTTPAGSLPPKHESRPMTSIYQDDEHERQDETDLFRPTTPAPEPEDQGIDYGNDFITDPLFERFSIPSAEDSSLDSTDASIQGPSISPDSRQSGDSGDELGIPDLDQDHQNAVTPKNVPQEPGSQALCCAPLTNTENISTVLSRLPLCLNPLYHSQGATQQINQQPLSRSVFAVLAPAVTGSSQETQSKDSTTDPSTELVAPNVSKKKKSEGPTPRALCKDDWMKQNPSGNWQVEFGPYWNALKVSQPAEFKKWVDALAAAKAARAQAAAT
ncbi:uncharacterized protein ARMOST_19395 [Armillaria ostoyae]|uniref:Uncharacterized protein n=1 Tax=Armillaria ostoyae TaxID=47428 RepID=A0A284S4H1_ARMOS|nr:uncharacterized protein ARMOST_19395 [Armillaria ostoyae]